MKITQLPRTLVNDILHHAQQTQAGDVCGVILEQQDANLVGRALSTPLSVTQLEPWISTLRGVYQTRILPQELPIEVLDLLSRHEIPYFLVQLNMKGVLELRVFHHIDHHFVEGSVELL